MAYSESLAQQIRTILATELPTHVFEEEVEEKKMFGGLAFMVRGKIDVYKRQILGTALLRWLNGEVTTANQASLIEEFQRGNGILLPIMLGVLAPIVEEIIFRGILPLKIFKGYEGWGYIVRCV